MAENDIVSTAIKIERELLARVQQAADERCLGRNLLICMAITKFLDELIPLDQLTGSRTSEPTQDKAVHDVFRDYLDGDRAHAHVRRVRSTPDPAVDSSGESDCLSRRDR